MRRSVLSAVVLSVLNLAIPTSKAQSPSVETQTNPEAQASPQVNTDSQWIRDSNVHRRAAPADSTPLGEWDMAPRNSPTTPVSGYFFINTTGTEYGNANAIFSQVQATNFSGVTKGQGPVANNSNCMLAGDFSAELPKCWGMLGEAQTLPSGWSGTTGQMFGVVGQVNGFNKTGNGVIRTAAAIVGYTISSYSGTKIQKAVSLYGVAPSTGVSRYLLDLVDSLQTKDVMTVTPSGLGNDTYGEKHARFGATCSTASQTGASCKTDYGWTTPFSDPSYTPVCWGVGPSGSPVLSLDARPQSGTITVRVMAATATRSSFAGVYCIAFHDP